jgi:CRISPR/Cas system CSM-associated protein Csm3 (group 7 of RAMP superfamily)
MNPYDFVRIDWSKQPKRERPVWHHRLFGKDVPQLYSGQLEVDIIAETPLFIFATQDASSENTREPARFAYNAQGDYIIPGSTLKGMIRNVFEALGNGCLTLFDERYKGKIREDHIDYRAKVPLAFQHCSDPTNLCIACHTFGMLGERAKGTFLGKVNIGDAVINPDKLYTYGAIYTTTLMEPKPYHASFYLDEAEKNIAGRKFYFHHGEKQGLVTADQPIYFGNRLANRYIEPLDYGCEFHFRVDFTNLTQDEFNALLRAIVLEETMRHKIGYGKPLGLGTIELRPTRLMLVDYATRYSTTPGANRGKTVYEEGSDHPLWEYLYERLDEFAASGLVQIAMDDLARIWRWPPEPNTSYRYPDKRNWFDSTGRGKRIADTRYA